MDLIESCIMDDSAFYRMSSLHETTHETYDDFVKSTMDRVAELNEKDYDFLYNLCLRITRSKITLMDEESCVSFTACSFFIDEQNKICITNPR